MTKYLAIKPCGVSACQAPVGSTQEHKFLAAQKQAPLASLPSYGLNPNPNPHQICQTTTTKRSSSEKRPGASQEVVDSDSAGHIPYLCYVTTRKQETTLPIVAKGDKSSQ
jgi:hypothetical protein